MGGRRPRGPGRWKALRRPTFISPVAPKSTARTIAGGRLALMYFTACGPPAWTPLEIETLPNASHPCVVCASVAVMRPLSPWTGDPPWEVQTFDKSGSFLGRETWAVRTLNSWCPNPRTPGGHPGTRVSGTARPRSKPERPARGALGRNGCTKCRAACHNGCRAAGGPARTQSVSLLAGARREPKQQQALPAPWLTVCPSMPFLAGGLWKDASGTRRTHKRHAPTDCQQEATALTSISCDQHPSSPQIRSEPPGAWP